MAKKLTDFYRILQVDPEADPDVVEAAYKRLARKYHPDLNPEPDANQRMKDINCAYETLGDPEKRAEYHQDWQREFGQRHYAGAEFSPQWLDGIRPSVTFEPSVVRFDHVQRGQVVEADVVMSLSRRGRFQGGMLPHQSWIKAKVAKRSKGAVVIRITVDTSALRGGVTYEGSVAITSLMYGTLLIPVRVTVAPEPRPILKVDPLWLDAGVDKVKELAVLDAQIHVLGRQAALLGEELRVTSQRVNLFETVKIPEARENIRRVQIYLGDEQTAAVVRGKIAKAKLVRVNA